MNYIINGTAAECPCRSVPASMGGLPGRMATRGRRNRLEGGDCRGAHSAAHRRAEEQNWG